MSDPNIWFPVGHDPKKCYHAWGAQYDCVAARGAEWRNCHDPCAEDPNFWKKPRCCKHQWAIDNENKRIQEQQRKDNEKIQEQKRIDEQNEKKRIDDQNEQTKKLAKEREDNEKLSKQNIENERIAAKKIADNLIYLQNKLDKATIEANKPKINVDVNLINSGNNKINIDSQILNPQHPQISMPITNTVNMQNSHNNTVSQKSLINAPQRKKRNNTMIFILIFIFIVLLGIGAFLIVRKYQNIANVKLN